MLPRKLCCDTDVATQFSPDDCSKGGSPAVEKIQRKTTFSVSAYKIVARCLKSRHDFKVNELGL